MEEDKATAEIEKLVQDGKLPSEAHRRFRQGTLSSEWVRGMLETRRYHVDHIEPIAGHWDREGWESSDEARWKHASDPDNLQVVTAEWNLSWGSKREDEEGEDIGGRYTFAGKFYVAPEFRSIYAEGGVPNALSVDDRSFLDEEGKALKG